MESPLFAQEKANFMRQGENLRLELESRPVRKGQPRLWSLLSALRYKPATTMVRIMAAILLMLVILAGSSFTVYAAQSSLPGEPLYAVKSWSEDVRLSLANTPQRKLDLILAFTDRRAGEISQLAENGMTVSDQASSRYQDELEDALQLAAEMDDAHIQIALGKIKKQAERQGMTLEELISSLPEQAGPAIAHLQERLQEQINLSSFGEHNPQGFRQQVHERQREHQGKQKSTPASIEPGVNPTQDSGNPMLDDHQKDKGSSNQKPTDEADHGGPGGGNSGNGKHNATPTP